MRHKSIVKKVQANYRREFPKELVHYLMITYGKEPFPHEYSEQDLYTNIKKDIQSFYSDTLDVTIKSPYKRLEEECNSLRESCASEERNNRELLEYIEELESLLMKNGISTESMKNRFKEENSFF